MAIISAFRFFYVPDFVYLWPLSYKNSNLKIYYIMSCMLDIEKFFFCIKFFLPVQVFVLREHTI